MLVADFDFELPSELIAQHPLPDRDASKLLLLDRTSRAQSHHHFRELPALLREGDVLIFNDSRVIPARLRGINPMTGGEFEMLLLEECGPGQWWAMVKPGKRARLGTRIQVAPSAGLPEAVWAEVEAINEEGHRKFRFHGTSDVRQMLETVGEVPLPPYIRRTKPTRRALEDRHRYQTVYARSQGSVAAPTAGLHFTPDLLDRLRDKGISLGFVTLHVGLGTFAPVKASSVEQHVMHRENYELPEATARLIHEARREKRRVIAVGTTTVRVLESAARLSAEFPRAERGSTSIFIHPPYCFQWVDGLITNFHLPKSTLLMLVSAFAAPGKTIEGTSWIREAYAEAVNKRYRFFSYGDAMMLL